MAIFKPKTSSTPSGFLGPIEVGIIGFNNSVVSMIGQMYL